ncbi:hypothetical protein O6H91_22G044900 [Diphasiastrum complanatum]|uniref:Uncharacterized protein n=1 Tax=Diphasiastrum complanatum TaxID=34168 RepID=A0ACC2AEY3_DIPCM|nr:hypothetical protein O6H91_22G044900 [Diphasiastrum complanatum]
MSGTAASAAKKGVGIFLGATKSGLSALTTGIAKARRSYGNKHETGVLQELRKTGLSPEDYVFQAFRRVYFLYLAGYKHELAAAAQLAGKRLTDAEKSSVPLDAVIILGHAVCEESLNYGDFEKGKFNQGMQDFLNKSRMGKDHFDRESISHDIYYSVLITAETYGEEWQNIERVFREAASRVIANAINSLDDTGDASIELRHEEQLEPSQFTHKEEKRTAI